MPLAEVAKVLSIPSGTVASRIHFAKKVLSAKLGGIVSSRSIRRSIALFAALLGAAALGFAAVKAGLPELLFFPCAAGISQRFHCRGKRRGQSAGGRGNARRNSH